MSRLLILMRHAKAEAADGEGDDFDRGLTARGHAAARLMGRWLTDQGPEPRTILCSPARRTRETLAGVLESLGNSKAFPRFPQALYEFGDGTPYLRELQALSEDSPDPVLVIGHNPSIHCLAERLAGRGAAEARLRLAVKFPTAAIALLSLSGGIAPGAAELVQFVSPKDLA